MDRKPIFENLMYDVLSVTVMYVFRANFNDTYYLDTMNIKIADLDRENLSWFDPFFGRSKISDKTVALSECNGRSFTVLLNENGKITEKKTEVPSDVIVCENYNDSMLLAAHITINKSK